uniref:Uncharacterized protein n=1 Tax=Arundo donax TaxID=35708 RepID=A0A0A9FXI9_ARUDO
MSSRRSADDSSVKAASCAVSTTLSMATSSGG